MFLFTDFLRDFHRKFIFGDYNENVPIFMKLCRFLACPIPADKKRQIL